MANTYSLTEDFILKAVKTKMEERLAECKEQIIKDALKHLEEDLRIEAGRIAINLATYYSVERYGPDLRITIHRVP